MTSELKAQAQNMSKDKTQPFMQCDGLAEFYVRDFKDFENAFKDPFYLKEVQPDELELIDPESSALTVGYEHVVLEDSKKVESHARNY